LNLRDGGTTEAKTVDISRTGVLVELVGVVERRLGIGERVTVQVPLVGEEGGIKPVIKFEAAVVRVEEAGRVTRVAFESKRAWMISKGPVMARSSTAGELTRRLLM